MAYPDDAQRALTIPAVAAPSAPPPAPLPLSPRAIALLFIGALTACVLAYLAFAVPGRWFPAATEKGYGAKLLSMSRGNATIAGDELVVLRAADDGNTVISVNTDLRAADYPTIAWIAAGVPSDARIALLWRTDLEPARLNTRALAAQSGQVLPIDMHDDPHWLGRIVGLALALQGPLAEPLHVRGVLAKPSGAFATLRDRAREWIAFEPWSGASINTVAGGADVQPLPLPLLLAAAILLTVAILAAVWRKQWRAAAPAIVVTGAALSLAAWFVLDARWTVNLARLAEATGQQYAGKDSRDKHLAAGDRDLYAFVDKARAVMPSTARVFVVADGDFVRGRTAYHLYPHNVWFDPYHDAVPPADRLRAGDWIVVYQRRGVQYDAAQHRLRWDGGATVPVELKLLDHGGALFLVQ